MKRANELTLGMALKDRAGKNGDLEYFVFPNQGVRVTYKLLYKETVGIARGLIAAGLKKGDHIGIFANNVPEWAFVFYAASLLGVVVVPINPGSVTTDLDYILNHADIKALFVIDKYRDSDCTGMLYQLIAELKNSKPGSLVSEKFPCLNMIVNMDSVPHQGMYGLNDLIKMGEGIGDGELKSAESAVCPDDVLVIAYTSGTTGDSKGVMLTHNGVIRTAFAADRLRCFSETDIVFIPLPFFHIMGLVASLVKSLLLGHKTVVIDGFDAEQYLKIIQEEKCTVFACAPTMCVAMLNHPRFAEYSMKSVRYVAMGGGVATPELIQAILSKMCSIGLNQGYGLTEASPTITDYYIGDANDPMLATVGDPIPGIEVSIRDPETNAECIHDVPGEICTRGFNVMKGYYKNEEATREAIDKDGWLHTGDLGHLLPNGCLVIDGRIKELIIRGGENIAPREIENLLRTMDGIQDAQVAGIPSKKYGEEVGAFVIRKSGVSITEQEIIDFCKDKISFFKIPKYVFFVESFPVSGIGKVQKRKLSEIGFKQIQEKGIAT